MEARPTLPPPSGVASASRRRKHAAPHSADVPAAQAAFHPLLSKLASPCLAETSRVCARHIRDFCSPTRPLCANTFVCRANPDHGLARQNECESFLFGHSAVQPFFILPSCFPCLLCLLCDPDPSACPCRSSPWLPRQPCSVLPSAPARSRKHLRGRLPRPKHLRPNL